MRRLLIAFTVILSTAVVAQVVIQASSRWEGVAARPVYQTVRAGLRDDRDDVDVVSRVTRSSPVVDVFVRMLETLKLKGFAKRMIAKGPGWLARLSARDIRLRTKLVDEDGLTHRYAAAIALLQAKTSELGDYLEFGVYNGSSLLCMHRVLETWGVRSRLVGFDSFEGLPPIAATDSEGHWAPGDFKSSIEFTKRVLDYEGVDWNRVTLVKGYFVDTLTEQRRRELGLTKASIIMIDCDLYQSAKEALDFCGPLITDYSVIFFDDWFPLAERHMGERKAFEEWLEADATLHSDELFTFPPYGKAFLVTRDRSHRLNDNAGRRSG